MNVPTPLKNATAVTTCPIEDRICRYCTQNKVDDEFHFLLKCNTFESLRIAYFEKIQLLNPTINMLEENQKFVSLLDPKSVQEAKITNRFIKALFEWRKKVDQGDNTNVNLNMFFV